jgi:disulfide bond formation protein DsbB
MSYSAVTTRNGQTELSLSTVALVLAGISFAALAAAWIFQFAGYPPCSLCLEERIPYYAAVPGGLLAAFLAGRRRRLAALIIAALALGFLYNAGLSIYHAGAEWHFWPGPDTCTGNGDLLKPKSLSEALRHNNTPRCDEAAIRILGVSLAGYNVLISGALAMLGGLAAWRGGRKEGRVHARP